ncbi:DUF3014 domain-containing protein [Shewanella sp. OMA3-2]|uniref:DUF3014 domain-containing protein n=1 Tax=Shewanella sp. OMA3-2 TaxID=2908650 RepID=UPI001F2A9AF8|nr:DUF3014 domain-containing protein [Shewanella sp. OMA3-2]UJF22510.1 DUF3014 domain-containing protein [Shewanella sp. OMA3-2]
MQVNKEDRATPTTEAEAKPNTNNAIIGGVIVALIVGAGYFYMSGEDSTELEPAMPTPIELPEPMPMNPIEEAPIEESITDVDAPESSASDIVPLGESQTPEVVAEPLPPLAESDDFVAKKTLAVANGMKIEPLILKKDMARQFVVFIDNLAQGELIRKASPMQGPDNKFTVSEITNKTYLNPDSYHRYDLYADFISGLNDQELAATYRELKPLFEEAFIELGYANMNFDERMQQAFKMIADAPIIEDPIELTSISVNYQYVDARIEALPNAQKLLVRMGPENTRKIKNAVKRLQPLLPQ